MLISGTSIKLRIFINQITIDLRTEYISEIAIDFLINFTEKT
jgi:hypothetical protein